MKPKARLWHSLRLLLLATGAAALVVGLWSGLALIGAVPPSVPLRVADRHGAIMVCGFFGTLISLERAVALGRGWAYAAPALSAAGALTLVLADAGVMPIALFLASGLVFTAASAMILLRFPALFTALLTVAAASWGIGTLLWLAGRPMAESAGWWLAFLVLTVTAERLELSRVVQPPRSAQAALGVAAALVIAGSARGDLMSPLAPFMGLGFCACAAWLLVYDVARRTIRQTGQTRFSAVCMLSGYGWLAVSGVLLLVLPPGRAAFSYDAAVHAVTIGFILSMVFGHALIILPAVSGLRVRYSAVAYLPWALLQFSVAIRVAADLLEWNLSRSASGMLTVIALAGFAATLIVASLRAVAKPVSSPQGSP
jgi:hypothetical protein